MTPHREEEKKLHKGWKAFPQAVAHTHEDGYATTHKPEDFIQYSKAHVFDGVVLATPEQPRLEMRDAAIQVFGKIAEESGNRRPVLLENMVRLRRGSGPEKFIPVQLQNDLPQLKGMFDIYTGIYGAKEPFMFLATEDSAFLSRIFEKKAVLMTQFTVRGEGALPVADRNILQCGYLGHFEPGSHVPLHSWSKKNSTWTVALIPY